MKCYWAVMPASSGRPTWTLANCRIEKALSGKDACERAFGRSCLRDDLNVGVWLCKNMGTHIRRIRSDTWRLSMLTDRNDWVDPYKEK